MSKFGTGAATTLALTAVRGATADHADPVVVSATLTNGASAVANAVVTFTLAPGAGSASCAATTTAAGLASCSLTPTQGSGTYPLVASYAGSSVPFLAPVNASAPFVVTLEQDALTYAGPPTAAAGQPVVLSGVLDTDDPAAGTVLAGRTVTLSLGTGDGRGGVHGCHRRHRDGQLHSHHPPDRRRKDGAGVSSFCQ